MPRKPEDFTHFRQTVRVEIDVVFRVPTTGAGETTRLALQQAAEKEVSHHVTTSKGRIEALRGPSSSEPIWGHGKAVGGGSLPERYIEADWPEEES